MRFEFLHNFMTIVDQCESCAFASTVLSPEAETGHLVLVRLVELGEFLAEFILRDIGAARVENITAKEMG